MTARRVGLLAAFPLLALWAGLAGAVDKKDFFERPATLAVALTGGDSPTTYSVVCNIDANAATQIRPAVTDRSRRKICFLNTSNVLVALGSSTVVASDFWRLGESTNAATSPMYCTNGSGAYYCATLVSVVSSSTVKVLEETQSVP